MSKHHVGVTTKLKKDIVVRLEFVAREKGMNRSALVRECILNFLAAQSEDEFPSFIAQNQFSSVA
ncbi:CopG family transcriptional regulator [Nostoc sp. CHAB 5715]|uniref:ribbon-helix-helix domain-containing protein n=1 Tax=Nostoc sp. CHAB 5715 TaxID=2780400 RepID=UPI001E43800B|nr:CopG family transcriptional regulator [Nostoc sp. CHAB 5715]MCC5621032.1 ribbon-helix-helix domain-containing protein [Nostoc sp. CHAB 5715]